MAEETANMVEARKSEGLGGRPAAGEDPAKREQILDGAHRVFMRMGFDASSMNDITREAGVSKGTLYVYFKNKEDLFAAIIQRQKSRIVERLQELLSSGEPIDRVLTRFGIAFSTFLLSEQLILAQRIVIGVLERMPDLAGSFFKSGHNNGPTALASYFERQIKAGNMLPVEDPMMTARQFGDLCLSGFYRPRLFGEMREPPTAEQIEKNVTSAVRMFLNTYGVRKA